MIVNFSVKNFRSFKDEVTLDLSARPLKSKKSKQDVILVDTGFGEKILPAAGIFGANAGGKSNLIRAMRVMYDMIFSSEYFNNSPAKHPNFSPFKLNERSVKEDTSFEITVFDKNTSTLYNYGFTINPNCISAEWLEIIDKPRSRRRSIMIFERNHQDFKFDKSVENRYQSIAGNVDSHALAITVFSFLNMSECRDFLNTLYSRISMIDAYQHDFFMESYKRAKSDEKFMRKLVNFIKKWDTNINDIMIDEIAVPIGSSGEVQHGPVVYTMHNIYNNGKVSDSTQFDFLRDESLGTKKLFELASIIIDVLEHGKTLIVDEFGSSLHPFVTASIYKLFNDPEMNKNGAQLIFSSHETYLLSGDVNARRDQIWLVKKNKFEESELVSLADDTDNRYDQAYQKRYLQGLYGAVPHIYPFYAEDLQVDK